MKPPNVFELAIDNAANPDMNMEEQKQFFELARKWWKLPDKESDTARNELSDGKVSFI